MAETNLKQKTSQGLLWGGINNGTQQLLQLAYGIYLARILNDTDYGMIGMLAIFTGVASSIVNCGFSTALINKKDATHKDYNAVFWFFIFVAAALYAILFFCAPLIARFYNQPALTNLSRFFFLSLFFGAMGAVSRTILFKKLMVKQHAIISLVSLIISSSVALILASNGYAYWAIAVQTVLWDIVVSTLMFVITPWKPSLKIDFSSLMDMLPFTIKIFFTSIFININNNVFSVIFGKFYSVEQVGIYTQGQKWASMGNQFIAGMTNSVAQPILVHVNEVKERQVSVLRKLIRFNALLSFPLILGLAFVGKEFIVITVGEKWLSSVPYLQLFCIWGAFSFLSALYTNLIFTHGKSNVYMYGSIVTGVLQLLVVFGMYPFGIFPMVIAYLTVNFVGVLIWQYFVHKLVGLRFLAVLKDIVPYLSVTLCCFAVAWFLTRNIANLYWLFTAKIVISGLLYLLILKLTDSVMFKESMEFLMKSTKK